MIETKRIAMALALGVTMLSGCGSSGGGDSSGSASPSGSQALAGAPAAPNTAILEWNPNSEPDLAGYKIYRASASGAYGAAIATVAANATTYMVDGLQSGSTYYFSITAFDTSGNESMLSIEVAKAIF